MVSAKKLQRFAEVSKKFNEATDSLNVLIKNVEKSLYEASPGFAFFSRPLTLTDDRWHKEGKGVNRIGWCKFADKDDTRVRWQLVLVYEHVEEDEDFEIIREAHGCQRNVQVITSVFKCSREIRLAVNDNLSQFIDDFTDKIEHKTSLLDGTLIQG
jgi:hypothetical protein